MAVARWFLGRHGCGLQAAGVRGLEGRNRLCQGSDQKNRRQRDVKQPTHCCGIIDPSPSEG